MDRTTEPTRDANESIGLSKRPVFSFRPCVMNGQVITGPCDEIMMVRVMELAPISNSESEDESDPSTLR
jgi:hypothetical protein